MGEYTKEIEWKPEQLTTWIKPTPDQQGKVAWSGVGLVDIDFARAFANDLLKKCNQIEELRNELGTKSNSD